MFEEENNFIEIYDDGKFKKCFRIFIDMIILVCVEFDVDDWKDGIAVLVEVGEMGVNFFYIMLDMGGGKIVILIIIDNVFYIDEKVIVVEVDEDE